MSWLRAVRKDDIPVGEVRTAQVGDEEVALCRVSEDELYAIEDVCPHDDGPLGEGWLVDHAIECPRHGARFDVRSGEVLRMPAATGIATYPVRVTEDGWVEVRMGDEE
jgi:3-phenylpropionate/trans-cinnamate dioxygenase ferredoxin subunit